MIVSTVISEICGFPGLKSETGGTRTFDYRITTLTPET